MFFEGYDDKPYVYAAISPTPPNAIIHLEVVRWSHNILKKLIVDWDILKKTMKNNGIETVAITKMGNLKDNEAYVKFLAWMGLPEPYEILIANYEI